MHVELALKFCSELNCTPAKDVPTKGVLVDCFLPISECDYFYDDREGYFRFVPAICYNHR